LTPPSYWLRALFISSAVFVPIEGTQCMGAMGLVNLAWARSLHNLRPRKGRRNVWQMLILQEGVVRTGAREQGRGVGGIRRRVTWLAWSLWTLTVVLMVFTIVFRELR
jgi:hypothetical protein